MGRIAMVLAALVCTLTATSAEAATVTSGSLTARTTEDPWSQKNPRTTLDSIDQPPPSPDGPSLRYRFGREHKAAHAPRRHSPYAS